MSQTYITENRSVYMRVLSDDQIREITRAAFDVMEKTGFKVTYKEGVKLLKQAGAIVKDDRVKVPRYIVEQCLLTAPKGFIIYDRDGNRAMEVEGHKVHYGTSTGSTRTKDALTGEVHETRLVDIALGAKIADALPNIDFVMPMGSAQGVIPALAQEVYEFEAVVTNTTKPVVPLSYSPRANELVYEMAAEVAGGLDNLREKPFILAYPEPITPLVFPEEMVHRLLFTAELGLPLIFGPVAQLGATGPVTLAGAIAIVIAESFLCLTLAQLRKPGTPCFLSANVAGFDMQHGNISVGAPEVSLGTVALAEIAHYYKLPSWGVAGATDAKILDAQAGVECAFGLLAQSMGGLNLIHDVGYMDGSGICSAEMLVLGDEVIGMVKRFIRGISVCSQTLPRALIEKVGPGGNYLQEDHTFGNFRNELWFPTLLTRQRYDSWQELGAKDVAQRIQEKIKNIIENHKPPSLSDKTLAAIEKIKRTADKELDQK